MIIGFTSRFAYIKTSVHLTPIGQIVTWQTDYCQNRDPTIHNFFIWSTDKNDVILDLLQ